MPESPISRYVSRLTAPIRSTEHFVGATATLLSGSVLAQILVYAARPAVTRLYPPEVFGLLTAFVAVTALLGTVATGRYVDALLLPDDDRDALPLIQVAATILLTFSGASLLFYWRGDVVASWFAQPELAPWLGLLPVALLGTGALQIFETWFTRTESYRVISRTRILRSGIIVLVQVAGGLAGGRAGTLIGGYVGGYVGAALALGGLFLMRYGPALRARTSVGAMTRSARRYARFLRYSTPAALLNNLGGRLPVLILLWYFDTEVVAFYGLAHGSLAVPLNLVNGAIGQVFFARAPGAVQENRLPALTRSVTDRLLALALPGALLAVALGPPLFETVFGSAWTEAGRFARYLGPWLAFAAVTSPLTRLFDVLEEQRIDFWFSAGMFAVHVTVLILGCRTGDPRTALLTYGVAGILLRVAHLGLLLRLAGVAATSLGRGLGAALGGGVLWVGLVALGYGTGALPALLGLGAGGLVYAWLLLRRESAANGPT